MSEKKDRVTESKEARTEWLRRELPDLGVRLHFAPKESEPGHVYWIDYQVIDTDEEEAAEQFPLGDHDIVLVSGSIKFDGCSHNDFGRGGYVHGCSRQEMARLGAIFEALFDWAGEVMPQSREEYLT